MMTFYCKKSSLYSQSCLILINLLKLDIVIEEQESSADDMNPIMTVPVLIDDNLILTDTRAILIYLAESSDFYPSDKRKRAIINQRLFYDASVVFPSLIKLIRSVVLGKRKEVPAKNKDAFHAVMKVLDGLLLNKKFFANDEISIADISILPTVFIAEKMKMNLSQYFNLAEWFERLKYAEKKELSYCIEQTQMLIKNVTNIF